MGWFGKSKSEREADAARQATRETQRARAAWAAGWKAGLRDAADSLEQIVAEESSAVLNVEVVDRAVLYMPAPRVIETLRALAEEFEPTEEMGG